MFVRLAIGGRIAFPLPQPEFASEFWRGGQRHL